MIPSVPLPAALSALSDLQELGRSPHAVVYAAQAEGEAVILKVFDPGPGADWKARELFAREAETLRQLDHPRIPRLLDFVADDESLNYYLLMSRTPGVPLSERLAAGWQPQEAEAVEMVSQALQILAFLHAYQPPLIHRDLKPSNLLWDAATQQLYLIDFGGVQTQLQVAGTGGSTVVGTYGYMAPEQFTGRSLPASDLYGLGATLIHLLTGRSPAELTRQDRLEIQFQGYILCSAGLSRWLARMVDPELPERFESAESALRALQQAVPLAQRPFKDLPLPASGIGSPRSEPAATAEALVNTYLRPASPASFAPEKAWDHPVLSYTEALDVLTSRLQMERLFFCEPIRQGLHILHDPLLAKRFSLLPIVVSPLFWLAAAPFVGAMLYFLSGLGKGPAGVDALLTGLALLSAAGVACVTVFFARSDFPFPPRFNRRVMAAGGGKFSLEIAPDVLEIAGPVLHTGAQTGPEADVLYQKYRLPWTAIQRFSVNTHALGYWLFKPVAMPLLQLTFRQGAQILSVPFLVPVENVQSVRVMLADSLQELLKTCQQTPALADPAPETAAAEPQAGVILRSQTPNEPQPLPEAPLSEHISAAAGLRASAADDALLPPESLARTPTLLQSRYRWLQDLSSGSRQRVWLAKDLQRQQRVVIKSVILAETPNWESVQLLEREKAVLTRIQHPRLPAVVDWQTRPDQSEQHLIMQQMPGENLVQKQQAGWRPTLTEVWDLLAQGLENLSALHSLNPPVVHRDLKPSNWLLDAQQRLYLIDLGAVNASEQKQQTLIGTYGYMAPEQYAGQASPRSDLYSLGVMWLELLSRQPVSALHEKGLEQVLQALAVPVALKAFLKRLLASEARERYADAVAALKVLTAMQHLFVQKTDMFKQYAQQYLQTLTQIMSGLKELTQVQLQPDGFRLTLHITSRQHHERARSWSMVFFVLTQGILMGGALFAWWGFFAYKVTLFLLLALCLPLASYNYALYLPKLFSRRAARARQQALEQNPAVLPGMLSAELDIQPDHLGLKGSFALPAEPVGLWQRLKKLDLTPALQPLVYQEHRIPWADIETLSAEIYHLPARNMGDKMYGMPMLCVQCKSSAGSGPVLKLLLDLDPQPRNTMPDLTQKLLPELQRLLAERDPERWLQRLTVKTLR
ncbi:MAG: serine/threonine protein kinase [Candidatus Sericytochromatia bacterium]|nr:serine/threonine protein kinase [Candidatus Sericytochromatia bacterium]